MKMPLVRHAVAASQGHALPSRDTMSTANMQIFWLWRRHSRSGKLCKTLVVRT